MPRHSERWLIVGHGSVGAALAERLDAAGFEVSIYDPTPRLPIAAGVPVSAPAGGSFAFAVSCVPPGAAVDVAPLTGRALAPGGLLFDWNTVAPAVKRRIAESAQAATVDVALLDSLDGGDGQPFLAVSGPAAENGAEIWRRLGFDVDVVGADVGQAAALKYLRSIFMKTLEALALEFSEAAVALDSGGVVRKSIARNLGGRYDEFISLLLRTNRIHAGRRASELADAVATLREDGLDLELAGVAAKVLQHAAERARTSDMATS
jgi:3-hydroxyisobutyrate dehydrogenase-like beta-hydroxyacid dehydrogenase